MNTLNKVCQAFGLRDYTDQSIITREMADNAIPGLQKLRTNIIATFPNKVNSSKIRGKLIGPQDALTVLREVLKSQHMKILSNRRLIWDPKMKKPIPKYEYRIIG